MLSLSARPRATAAGLGLAAVVASGLALAPTAAHAAGRDGACDPGEFCYYYNSNQAGAISDFTGSISDLGSTQPSCYEFRGGAAGAGQCTKNHAASVWNRSSQTVTVYYNSGFGGSAQAVAPGQKANLNAALKNQNASHRFGTPPPGGSVIGNDYPYSGATSGVDPWNFYKGQCTSFAAWRVNHQLGVPFSNSYKGQHWGNAVNWDNAARAAGVSVTGSPRVGDIAVRNSGTYGHVAYVAKVNSNGSFVVEDYNHLRPNTYGTWTATVGTGSSQFDQFIHFKG